MCDNSGGELSEVASIDMKKNTFFQVCKADLGVVVQGQHLVLVRLALHEVA